jgi:hypothetical protein
MADKVWTRHSLNKNNFYVVRFVMVTPNLSSENDNSCQYPCADQQSSYEQ